MRRNSFNRFTTSALATSVLLALHGTAMAATAQSEIDALNAFYTATNGDNWTDNTGWKNGDPCGTPWKGIGCATGADGNEHVTSFELNDNNLTGTLPPEIGDLSELIRLELRRNKLTGSIPKEIGNLKKLELLYIDQNQLSGNIPTEIGGLSSLTLLGIGGNHLTGTVPASIGDLSNVEKIYLVNNKLSGSLPSTLTNLTKLKHLYIDYNAFTGELPDLSGTLDLCDRTATNVASTCSAFSYNGLSANWSVDIEKYSAEPFASTQTVAPKNVTVNATGEKTIDVSWDLITYQDGDGKYVVTATSDGNPDKVAETSDKKTNTAQLTGLVPGTDYSITVKTVTVQPTPGFDDSYTRTIKSLPSAAKQTKTKGTKPVVIGPADAEHSSFSANKTSVDIGEKVTLTVIVRDKDNNNLNKGGDTVTFSANSSDLATLTPATDHGDGSYTAQLTGVKAGEVTVEAKLNGSVVGQQKITIKATSTDNGTSANNGGGGSGSTGFGLLMALAGLWRVGRTQRQRH